MSKRTICNLVIYYIFIFSYLIKAQSTKTSSIIIEEIYPSYYNTTSAFISLTNSNAKKYVYFTFDFSNIKPKNIAYFKITTDSMLYYTNIQYIFTNKNMGEINYSYLEGRNQFWFFIKGHNFRKEKSEQGFDSYLTIEKNKNADGTILVIRIDIDKLKGDIIAENLESLPIEDKSLTKNNKYQYNNNYDYNHNNRHDINDAHNNAVINNEKRYSSKEIHDKYYHYHKEWRYHSHERIQEVEPIRITYGIIMAQIWLIILVLYCIINRRKKNAQYTVAINNSVNV